MIPITPVVPGFDLPTVVFAQDQPEYNPLPAHRQPDGRERLTILLTGNLWLQVLTDNDPLQPVKLDISCPIFGHYMGDPEI